MAEHHESNKFYGAFNAFDAFDSNAHLAMAENHEWNKFHDAQVEHARQETAGSNEIPVISWQQYSHEWIRWPDLFGFCGNRQEPATTGNRIRSPVHCIRFLPFSDGIPAKYCTFPGGFHRKCMGILLPGNIDLGDFDAFDTPDSNAHIAISKNHESKTFYDAYDTFDAFDAFDAFDSNAHIVMAENHESKTFYNAHDAFDAFEAFDSNAHLVMAKHHESKKFYDAFDTFDAFDSNAHLVMAEHHESNKFYGAFDALDSSGHLVMAEH